MKSKAQMISLDILKVNSVISIGLFFFIFMFACIGADITLREIILILFATAVTMTPGITCYLLAMFFAKALKKSA